MRMAALSVALLLLPAPAAAAQVVAPEGAPPAPPSGSEEAPARADFSVIYEGRTGGISGAASDLWAEPRVAAALQQADGDWQRGSIGFGAFLGPGGWLLQATGGTRKFRAAGGDIEAAADAAQDVPVLLADDYAVFAWPAELAESTLATLEEALSDDPLKPPPRRETRSVTPARFPDGSDALFVQAALDRRPPPAIADPNNWEVRLRSVFTGQTASGKPAFVFVVSRLEGEGARRAELVAAWSGGEHLYLSAGESVEGRSYLAARTLSLQRPNTWAFWKEAGLDGLAPGEAELIAGVDQLRAEAAEAGVPLVSANLCDAAGKPLFERWRVTQVAGRQVVLIGWSDPQLLSGLPPEQRAALRVRDVSAVFEVLAELPEALGGDPDLVVLFGAGARPLSGHLPGVDLVLGDFSADLRLPRWEEVGESALRARALEHRRARSPALVSRLGGGLLGRVDLSFDPETSVLRKLGHLRARLGEELPAEGRWLARVQDIRQGVYSQLEDILLPDLRTLSSAGEELSATSLGAREFALLAANLMMERTGSDLTILRPLPRVPELAGPAQQLFVDAALAVPDEVVVIELTGTQLLALTRTLPLIPSEEPASAPPGPLSDRWAWSAGLTIKGAKLYVRGRLVGRDEWVRLATTDFVAGDPRYGLALKKARSYRLFDGPGWRRQAVSSARGSAWPLRLLVGEALVSLRSLDPEFGDRYAARLRPLLKDQRGIGPRFTLELDGIALQLTGSVPIGDRLGYESSREGRVQQETAFSAAVRGRIAATWEDKRGSVSGFLQGAFGRSKVPGVEEPVELEDDLLVGAEGRLKVVTLPAKLSSIRLSTFAQTAFDTEFVAGDDGAGGELPRQKLWRTTAGVALSKYWWFKEFKAGFFVEYDFAAEEGPLAPGFTTSLKAEKRWGPVRWSALGDLRGYLPTENDSPEDLLFTLQLRSELAVLPLGKMIPGLSIGAFVDALLFRGKVAETSQPGMHLLMGATLSYDRDLRAPLPLR